jgi:hypothetical protein
VLDCAWTACEPERAYNANGPSTDIADEVGILAAVFHLATIRSQTLRSCGNGVWCGASSAPVDSAPVPVLPWMRTDLVRVGSNRHRGFQKKMGTLDIIFRVLRG